MTDLLVLRIGDTGRPCGRCGLLHLQMLSLPHEDEVLRGEYCEVCVVAAVTDYYGTEGGTVEYRLASHGQGVLV